MAVGLLIGHAWTFHLVDPRGWTFVGLGPAAWRARLIATSAALGALAIVVPSAALLGVGWLRVVPAAAGSSLGAAVAALAVLIPAALWEELFVRGYAFAVLRERWGPLPAIIVTSQVFGWLHLLNAGASLRAVLVVILAGMFLGLIRERTESLYAAWAAHLAWNVALVVFFHATVSGLTMAAPDYRMIDAGPDWATGGVWGPEGGMFAAASLAAATWLVFRRTRRRSEPDA
jgi:membrane protease YdiL (CAAX protease family)